MSIKTFKNGKTHKIFMKKEIKRKIKTAISISAFTFSLILPLNCNNYVPSDSNISTIENYSITLKASQKVEKAAKKTEKWLEKRTKSLFDIPYNVFLGPCLDPAFFYRIEQNAGEGLGINTEEKLKQQKQLAINLGIPNILDSPELEMIYLLNWKVRIEMQKKNKNDKIFVLKHFPGGPDENVELVESKPVIYAHTLEYIKQTYTKPFIRVINSDLSPSAIMVTHCSYPVVEVELAEKYSNIKLGPFKNIEGPLPASLSPIIIQGFLRKELKFDGLIYSDWYNMGAINTFMMENKNNFPEELKNMSERSLILILSIYAGINKPMGICLTDVEIKSIEEYYNSNEDFKISFDNLVGETIEISKNISSKLKKEKLDISLLNFTQKLQILNSFQPITVENEIDNVIDLNSSLFNFWTDIWTRTGIIIFYFRTQIISEITGIDYPDPKSDYDIWIKELISDSEFKTIYDSINWSDDKMIEQYNRYLNTIIK